MIYFRIARANTSRTLYVVSRHYDSRGHVYRADRSSAIAASQHDPIPHHRPAKDGLCDEAPLLIGLTPAIRAEIRAINANLAGEDAGKLKPIKERCVHGYGAIGHTLA